MYVQSDTLLLADVFGNFRNMCVKIYELDPAPFLSAPGLAWQACLKKAEVKLELLTDVDMLLMVESSFLEFLDENNLYSWAMSEPLPANGFDGRSV